MNAAQLLEHFDRVGDAPNAIVRLRQAILKLAVRGKLLPQKPRDCWPEKSLELVRERLEAKAEKTSRLQWKRSDPLESDEYPADIPSGWMPARINDSGLYINGMAFKPSDWKKSGLPIVRIQNLTDRSKEFNYAQGTFPDEVLVRDGDILVSWSATLEAFIWSRGAGVLNQHIFRVLPNEELTTTRFLHLLLRNAIQIMAQSEHAHGLAMMHINRAPFLAHVLLIPPVAEQERIVSKFDELMAFCDRLETARAEREATRDRLSAASLARLNAPDPEAFQADAHFVLDALPALTTRPDQIKQLRQTILNLAVRGKLVPQVAGDEPASELLKRIAKAKGGARRPVAVIDPEGEPYPLPETWKWATLDQLIVSGPQNGISPKPTTREDAPKAITLTATTSGAFNPNYFKHVEANIAPDSDFWLKDGDLLFQRGNTREYVGIAAVYQGPPNRFLFPDLIMKVRVSALLSLQFVHLASVSPPARAFLSTNASGAQATMPKINQTTLVSLPIPLPPLAEQHRIVAMVDELMALCDRLEASLSTGNDTCRRLLDALLAEALAPAEKREEAA
jgi:type I restriction enzyme S subunit